MNGRIKEFMVECYNPYGEFRYDKFAELVIKECARVAAVTPCPYEDEHQKQTLGHTWDMACVASARQVRQLLEDEKPQGWVCPKCGADRTKTACPLGFGATVDGRCPMTLEA